MIHVPFIAASLCGTINRSSINKLRDLNIRQSLAEAFLLNAIKYLAYMIHNKRKLLNNNDDNNNKNIIKPPSPLLKSIMWANYVCALNPRWMRSAC